MPSVMTRILDLSAASAYPSDLIETVGFDVDAQLACPSITNRRSVIHRVFARACVPVNRVLSARLNNLGF